MQNAQTVADVYICNVAVSLRNPFMGTGCINGGTGTFHTLSTLSTGHLLYSHYSQLVIRFTFLYT